jgi:hypothetical protein
MTDVPSKGRPAWSVHPPDIQRALKSARSRCHALLGTARRNGNQPVVDAFTIVLDKIKAAQQAVRDARAAYGWESVPEADEAEGADATPRLRCPWAGCPTPDACDGTRHRRDGQELP